jgi:hypothetical protein
MTQNMASNDNLQSAKGSYSITTACFWLIQGSEMSLDTLIAGLSLSPQQAQSLIAALTKSSESDSPPELEDVSASTTDVSAHDTASATAPTISTHDTAYDISGIETVHSCSQHAFPAHTLGNEDAEALHHQMKRTLESVSRRVEPMTLDTMQWKEVLLLKEELRRAVQWKEEASHLKEDLQRAIAAMNSMASPAQTNSDSYPLGYHVPLPSDTGPFYAVTRGRQIGVFSGW